MGIGLGCRDEKKGARPLPCRIGRRSDRERRREMTRSIDLPMAFIASCASTGRTRNGARVTRRRHRRVNRRSQDDVHARRESWVGFHCRGCLRTPAPSDGRRGVGRLCLTVGPLRSARLPEKAGTQVEASSSHRRYRVVPASEPSPSAARNWRIEFPSRVPESVNAGPSECSDRPRSTK